MELKQLTNYSTMTLQRKSVVRNYLSNNTHLGLSIRWHDSTYRKLFQIRCFHFLLLMAALLVKLATATEPVRTVAVTAFSAKGVPQSLAVEDFIVDMLQTEIISRGPFKLLERNRLKAVLTEQALSLSGLVDSDSAVASGGLLGAAYILTGNLNKFGGVTFLSARLIDNRTGVVEFACMLRSEKEIALAAKEMTQEVVQRLQARMAVTTRDPAIIWQTEGTGERKPILIYVLSDVKDSLDGQGQSWYFGPDHIRPVMARLKANGFSVEVHDRNSLASLVQADLTRYSQIWLLEGDANGVVNTTSADVAALLEFYNKGGGVWLCGESPTVALGMGDYTEDINAFAAPFGAKLDHVILTDGMTRILPGTSHPLLAELNALCFDNEVGAIECVGPEWVTILPLSPQGRLLKPNQTLGDLYAMADPSRANQSRTDGEGWSLAWMLGKNFPQVGPEIGRDRFGIAVRDERSQKRGRAIIDSGWLLGWAFNGVRSSRKSIGDDLLFVRNVAHWLK